MFLIILLSLAALMTQSGPQPPDRHPGLLTWEEAARLLGCSRSTLKRIKAAGEIGYTQVGTGLRPRVYFSTDDIDEYLKSKRTAPRPSRRQAS